jgi:hypothetical protein
LNSTTRLLPFRKPWARALVTVTKGKCRSSSLVAARRAM